MGVWRASVVAVLMAGTQGSAQAVTGRVRSEADRETLSGVTVSLVSESSDTVARAATDGAGRYLVRAPAAGSYRVVADHLGYPRLESPLATFAEHRGGAAPAVM